MRMLGSTREKCGVGISGDRRIRARNLAICNISGPPAFMSGSPPVIFQNGTA